MKIRIWWEPLSGMRRPAESRLRGFTSIESLPVRVLPASAGSTAKGLRMVCASSDPFQAMLSAMMSTIKSGGNLKSQNPFARTNNPRTLTGRLRTACATTMLLLTLPAAT